MPIARFAAAALAIAICAATSTASAQDMINPGAELFGQGLTAPGADFAPDTTQGDFAPIPYAPEPQPAGVAAAERRLSLEAHLAEGSPALNVGVTWRVFAARPGPDGQLPLLVSREGGSTTMPLAAGDYLVHAAFGRAGATKRVTLREIDRTESLVLDAGGLKLDAVVGDEEPIAPDALAFEILQENENGELVTIVPKARAGPILRLGSGTYHVIARYGSVNAIVRADIQVEPGKVTEAVLRLTGAEVTLKLVSAEGGEALANTSWTVLNQDGATVHESVGAFPNMILAEGAYTAVATHQSEIYSRDFQVESGLDRDVEVQLTDLVKPEPAGTRPEIADAPMEP